MADDFIGLTEIATLNDENLADIEVTDLLDRAPLLARLNAATASNGTAHKYLKETGAPVVGFRAPNAGREHDHSEDTLVTINLKILDASFTVDKAVADAYTKGGPSALIAREGRRHLKAAFFMAEKQLIQGVNNDSGGFVGLEDATGLDALADAMVNGAGGTTALSSVYAIRTEPSEEDCTLIVGQAGNIQMGESQVQRVTDGSSKHYPAYFTPIDAWLGLQLGSAYSVGRLANLDAGSNTLDDDAIYDLLELFPSDRQPNVLAMGRRSLGQLRKSRTATNATGAPAPIPTEVAGIPIVTTEAIGVAETQVT